MNGSDRHGIGVLGGWAKIENCYLYDCDVYGIQLWDGSLNSTITSNQINTTGDDGIYVHANADDCVITDNRITAWTNEAIDDDSGGTCTIADNETT